MSAEIKPTVFEHAHPAPANFVGALGIFLALALLTVVALMVGFLELGAAKVWVSLAVSVIQTVVLTVFFMELRHADKQTWLIAVASLFWTFLLFLFTLTDYLTRHYYAF